MVFEWEKSESIIDGQFFSIFKSINLKTIELWRIKLRKCRDYATYDRF